jgi:glycosidase
MYEINERAFSTVGTLAGILPRLDSIKALGVNTIWLMPINPIGTTKTVNSPYCISNFRKVNPEFGDLESLRTLVREAHKRDMAVVLDWVANHTSWDHPWVAANKNWYTQDGSGNIIHPATTNWQDVADLNFDNIAMKREMIREMKYWLLDANIDGFRCDAADFVPFAFWKEAIDSIRAIPNRKIIMLAEGARPDHFAAGFNLNFAWDYYAAHKKIYKDSGSALPLASAHTNEHAAIPLGAQKLRFTSNHDECAWDNTPLVNFSSKAGSLAAFATTVCMGGVPLIYNGQEVGCPVKLPFFSKQPIDWTTNPDMLEAYKKILAARSSNPALLNGDFTSHATADVVAFLRKSGNNQVFFMANTRNSVKSYAVPAALQNTNWQNLVTGQSVSVQATVQLQPYQYLILK